jgi:hypothetical protein
MAMQRTREQNRLQKRRNYQRQKATVLARGRRWRAVDPERAKRTRRREWLRRYGLTLESFDALLASQGNRCGNTGCSVTEPGGFGNQWHVDHDRRCCPNLRGCVKCIRGLLCSKCNQALGLLGENTDCILGLKFYIQKYHNSLDNVSSEA